MDRRTSGFSKAISPMDANYNPQSNQNVQGVTTINPDDLSLFMAGVAQHGVQNQTYGTIHPQSSRVKFEDERGAHHHGNQNYNRGNKPDQNLDNQGGNQNGESNDNQNVNYDQRSQGGNPGGNPGGNSTNQFNNWSPNPKLTLYKRTPLPTSVKWTSATAFEDFFNSFTAHIGQQLHLQ